MNKVQSTKNGEQISGHKCYLCLTEHKTRADILEHIAKHLIGNFICGYCFQPQENKTMEQIVKHRRACRNETMEEMRWKRFERFVELNPELNIEYELIFQKASARTTYHFIKWEQGMIDRRIELADKDKKEKDTMIYITRPVKRRRLGIPLSAQRQIKEFMSVKVIQKTLYECPPTTSRTATYDHIPISELKNRKRVETFTKGLAEIKNREIQKHRRILEEEKWSEISMF